MSIVVCPGCGNRHEANGAPCPVCAYRKDPQFRKKLLQFTALFAILGGLWLCFLLYNLAEKKDQPAVRDAAGQIITSP